jgi:hypothetical protein
LVKRSCFVLTSPRYFVIHNLAEDEPDVVRYAALLRGTESAWQALSYGLGSLAVFGEVGGIYMNFGLWAVAIFPAWLVIRGFGTSRTYTEEGHAHQSPEIAKSRETTSSEDVPEVKI